MVEGATSAGTIRKRSGSKEGSDRLVETLGEYPLEQFPNWTISSGERYYVRAPVDKFGEWAFHVRSHITMLILSGNPAIQFLQTFNNPLLTKLAYIFSWFGLEEFYFSLVVSCVWLFDARLGRLLSALLSVGFFVAGCMKNALCLPRPPSPPALLLGEENRDWAWPSNHALLGTAFPWFIWIYASNHYDMSIGMSVLLLTAVLIWNVGIIWSRVYLGVHSPCDIVAGWMIGVLLLFIFQGFSDRLYTIYEFASTNDQSFFYYFTAVILFLIWLHPRPWPETQSLGEVVSVLSGTCGIWCARIFHMGGENALLSLFEQNKGTPIYMYGARFLLGVVVILCMRLVVKPIAKAVFSLGLKVFGVPFYSYSAMCKKYGKLAATKRFTQRMRFKPIPGDKTISIDAIPFDMDLLVKFVVYGMVGTMVGEGCPAIFKYLEI